MNMSLFDKIGLIFKYIFSSFLSIEIFIFSLLLLFLLIYNIKRKNKFVGIATIGVYLGFLIGIMISYSSYVKICVDAFVKSVMNYIYFPSTIVYFFIFVFVTCLMLTTIYSKKITNFKRIVNYIFFSILYFFFMSFVSIAAYNNIDLVDITSLYKNSIILSIVQISNLLLVIWIVFTIFYRLYKYFKAKFD